MIDWGAGRYERTASELEPASEHVVALAALVPGVRVLDLATGTGNAALRAARAGASATGVDGAPRLLEVARSRAAQEGLVASFVESDLEELPFADGTFDVALSVFGVIFARDPDRALAEMLRVLGPGGRALITVWVPAGPIDAMVGTFVRATVAVTGPGPPRFAWHDKHAVTELAARHGAQVEFHEAELTIVDASPDAYLDANQELHPMAIMSRPVLERAGTFERTREQALAILREANEDPTAFSNCGARESAVQRNLEAVQVGAGRAQQVGRAVRLAVAVDGKHAGHRLVSDLSRLLLERRALDPPCRPQAHPDDRERAGARIELAELAAAHALLQHPHQALNDRALRLPIELGDPLGQVVLGLGEDLRLVRIRARVGGEVAGHLP
jgi:SAM-dependent methyltransferase